MEQVSWEPRAFLLHNFLNEEECNHLIELSDPSLEKSTVVDNETGGSIASNVRTSKGMFLRRHHDEVVTRIERRLALVTMLPEDNGEQLQILKYEDGEKYDPHTDYFHDKFNTDPHHGGQRVATVLMYLTTPEDGGETVFPYADEKVSGPEWSDCALKGLAVKAVRGNALLFYSLKPDGTEDPKSTHGSCPTLKGVKYSATRWLHVSAFAHASGGSDEEDENCDDENDRCEEWAIYGECDRNPDFMTQYCRKSCKGCDKVLLQKAGGRKAGIV